MDVEEIVDFDALCDSMQKCRKGVSWKGSVLHFILNDMEECYKLSEELKNGTYKERRTTKFKITKPKEREIISISFRDRVYQRSLNDNAIYPTMTKSFIRDNWACQKGKGTDDARARMKVFLWQMYQKYGTDFWGLQMDIHGYYPNMRHDKTEELLAEKLEEEIYRRAAEILNHQYAGDTGYNPGSQMVQIVGIAALDDHDHMIREQIGAEKSGRYMDDTQVFDHSRERLEYCMDEIQKVLAEKGLEFNPKKTRIFHIREGFMFLGFWYRLTDTGKVIMTLDSKRVKDKRHELRKLVNKAKRGEITKAKVDESYNSWKNHVSKGDSYMLLQRMDKFYKELWRQ
jgi:hypothetical protein